MSLFDFFKRQKEYVSCERLEYGMNIFHSGLSHCDMCAHHKKDYGAVIPLKNRCYDFSAFYKEKKRVRKMHQNGTINERCEGCYNLKRKKWDLKFQIKHIDISPNLKCNADCIYCFSHKYKKIYNSFKDIPVYSILEYAVKKKIISSDCEVEIGGGEPVLIKEFEDIMNLFLDNHFNKINFHSSGIQFSPAIARGLSMDACTIFISADSGEKGLYKQIKNVDKFDELKSTVTKYCMAQGQNKHAVWLKYIIIPNINDNIEAINTFFNLVKETGCLSVATDVEREWYKAHKNNIDEVQKMIDLMKYMEVYCKTNNIKHTYYPTSVHITNDYRKMYDDTNIIL